MKTKVSKVILCAAVLLPLAMVAVFWNRLPAQVPIHWSMNGTVDSYAGRVSLWGLAALNPLIAVLMAVMPRLDPKRGNYVKFEGSYFTFRLIVALLLDGVMAITITESLRPGTVSVGLCTQLMVGLMLVLIGNMMPKFRQTWFCGIKNAWTLSSERIWTRTHRLGGYSYFLAGLICMACAFLPAPWNFALTLGSVLTAALLPFVMSYVWYRQETAGKAI